MNYRLLSPALAEMGEAAEFYEGRVAGLGADFLDEMDAAIEMAQATLNESISSKGS